jgi:hypothetical protein
MTLWASPKILTTVFIKNKFSFLVVFAEVRTVKRGVVIMTIFMVLLHFCIHRIGMT